MRTNKKALRKHKRQEPNLTPLLKHHFDELQFDLRLKFNTPVVLDGETVSEAWVGSMVFSSDEKRDAAEEQFVKALDEWAAHHGGVAVRNP